MGKGVKEVLLSLQTEPWRRVVVGVIGFKGLNDGDKTVTWLRNLLK